MPSLVGPSLFGKLLVFFWVIVGCALAHQSPPKRLVVGMNARPTLKYRASHKPKLILPTDSRRLDKAPDVDIQK